MFVKKHLSKDKIDEIVRKLRKLAFREVKEKHEALLHRFDSKNGVIKIYKKMKKSNDFSLVISGSTDFEEYITSYLFGDEKELKSGEERDKIVVGIDESGVDNAINFVVSGVSYKIFDLIDSKKVSREKLNELFIDAIKNSEFLAFFKFHKGLLDYIKMKGYRVQDVVNEIALGILGILKSLGLNPVILIDGSEPEGVKTPKGIKYVGKSGELKDQNIAAAGVISTYLRRLLN